MNANFYTSRHKSKIINHYCLTWLVLISLILISGCKINSNIQSTHIILTESPALTVDSTPTFLYQLTYMSNDIEGYDSVFSIDIGCLENEKPCMSEPKLLFKMPYGEKPGAPIGYPQWSPDGGYVSICAVGNNGQADIFVANINKKDWRNITDTPIYECETRWLPDGQQLIYLASSFELYQGSRVFSVTPFGGERIQLLKLADKDAVEISLSPDGKKIAFTSQGDNGFEQLFISNLDGSNLVQLTSEYADHLTPTFSPDGQHIAFEREFDTDSPNSQIVVLELDDNSEIEIGQDLNGIKTWLSWAPIGDWIAFSSNADGDYEIYLINLKSNTIHKVTSSNKDELFPEWRFVGGY